MFRSGRSWFIFVTILNCELLRGGRQGGVKIEGERGGGMERERGRDGERERERGGERGREERVRGE